jgi:7-cyano-7-deazaguanine synthase
MKRIVLGLSGGMDSATLLGYYLEQGAEVHCCSFYYGSKHGGFELQAAKDVVTFYQHHGFTVVHHLFDLSHVFKDFKSALLLSGSDIPEGHYEEESMKQTVVPGRNLIFASIMAGLAESIEAEIVALGVHSGDHHIYPDCRPEFVTELARTVLHSTQGKIVVVAPFLNDNKASILIQGYGFEIPVPYELTRTCYKNQLKACGKCGSCQERLEAFEIIGIKDPIEYESL